MRLIKTCLFMDDIVSKFVTMFRKIRNVTKRGEQSKLEGQKRNHTTQKVGPNAQSYQCQIRFN